MEQVKNFAMGLLPDNIVGDHYVSTDLIAAGLSPNYEWFISGKGDALSD